MNRLLFVIFFILFSWKIYSQEVNAQRISFQAVYGDLKIDLSDSSFRSGNKEVIIETLKFYISSVELYRGTACVWKEKNSYHLIDASLKSSLGLNLPKKINYDRIKFNLGIDSLTSVSGAMGGDLDPTKGMYWTWQSGYVNFKLEGKSKSSLARNNEFQFHLGGYQFPENALQKIDLPVMDNENVIIQVDAEKFLKETDLTKQDHLMSPGPKAIELSKVAAQIFSIR